MKQRIFFIGGLIFLVGVLVAAAYTAALQLTAPKSSPAGTGALLLATGNEDEATMAVRFEGAAELPDRPPDTWGILLSEVDGRYLIGSGPNSVSVTEVDEQLKVVPHHEGPEVEVVAKRDTVFYEDLTNVSAAAASGASGEITFQQEVRLRQQPPEMPEAANFLVWGERRGERLIADVILYRDEGYK